MSLEELCFRERTGEIPCVPPDLLSSSIEFKRFTVQLTSE